MASLIPPDPDFADPGVRAVFDAHPAPVRDRLLQLRDLIFATADELEGVGELEEALRWGEPSYLTTASKSGTTIRLGCKDPESGLCALYVHCQTDLVETFRARHGAGLVYEGKRALLIPAQGALPVDALRDCISLALTYRLRKAAERRRRSG